MASERSPLDADEMLRAFIRTFYVRRNGRAYFKLSTTGGRATFWQHAEMIEMIEDAYRRTRSSRYRTMIGELYRGVVGHWGERWLFLRSNDDAVWMIIACLRAYGLTGDRLYLNQARWHFDQIYARAWSSDLGGGLWETIRHRTKNACVNAPATIAACLLYRYTHDRSYLTKAKRIFHWLRETLYDPASGAVYDNVFKGPGTSIARDLRTFTYNQGTFIGACDLLYQLTRDRRYYGYAVNALGYAQAALTIDGVLHSEVSGNPIGAPGGGFKGIFARWAVRFTRTHGLDAYEIWFDANAAAIRKQADGRRLVDQDWSRPTGSGRLPAFACSSAVVMLQVWPR